MWGGFLRSTIVHFSKGGVKNEENYSCDYLECLST
jgi:hypothetical protein